MAVFQDAFTGGFQLSWTPITGGLSVVADRVRVTTVNVSSYSRADHDVGSADMYAKVVIPTLANTGTGTPRTVGVCARCDAAGAVTFYHARLNFSATLGYLYQLYQVVTGTFTQLGSNVVVTPSFPETLQLDCSGSLITLRRNTEGIIALTNTVIPTGSRGGIRLFDVDDAANAEGDSFETGDLVLPVPGVGPQGGSRATRSR